MSYHSSLLSFGNQQSNVYQHPACTLLSGEIRIPGSKSYAIRIIALALLNFSRRTRLYHYGPCDDVFAAISCAQTLGAKVLVERDYLEISAPSRAEFMQNRFSVLPVGESALCGRMFAIIAALTPNKFSLGRRGSLRNRSFAGLAEIAQQLGIEVEGSLTGDFSLRGPLSPPNKPIIIDASHSSQYLTGLLFALSASSPATKRHIICQNLVSRPYIALSLRCLEYFYGADFLQNNDYRHLIFSQNPPREPRNIELCCEADWSLAANFVVLGAIAGADEGLKLTNLPRFSLQADKIIVDIVLQLGAQIEWSSGTLFISRIKQLKTQTIEIDLTDCPDLFPALAVLHHFFSQVNFNFQNASRLQDKESNRTLGLSSQDFSDHRVVFAHLITNYLSTKNLHSHINITASSKSAPSFISLLNNH